MGEDRRPNVGGRPIGETERTGQDPQEPPSEEQLELDARTLGHRRSADGHEREPQADGERE